MGVEELKTWATLILSLLSIFGVVVAWLRAGRTENADRIHDLEKDARQLSKEFELLKQEVNHLPSAEALHEVQIALTKMDGTIDKLSESFRTVKRTTDNIDMFLRKAEKQ